MLQFVDFWRQSGESLACLIFDSKFTTYQHLERLDRDDIKFITLRGRGKRLVDEYEKDTQGKKGTSSARRSW